MTKGTPASSQIIWLERRVTELEAKIAEYESREPVAWMISSKDWFPMVQIRKPTMLLSDETLQPLFLGVKHD